MKYVCFGYYDKGKFDGMKEGERNAMFDTCFEYDDHLRASGHWAVGRRDFSVLPVQGQGGLRPLKRFSTGPVPAGAKMVVIFKACIEHGVSLALSHAIEFAFVVVAKTEVFHCSSPLPSGSEPAA